MEVITIKELESKKPCICFCKGEYYLYDYCNLKYIGNEKDADIKDKIEGVQFYLQVVELFKRLSVKR